MEFNSEYLLNKKGLILVFAILIFLLFVIKREKIHHKITEQNKLKPAFVFESVKVIELKKGKSIWKFNASKAIINKTKKYLKLYGLTGNFLESEKNILELNTPVANLDLIGSNLKIFNGKISTTSNPIKTLTADNIIWKSKEESITASGNVKIIQDNIIIKSTSLISDNKLKKVKITGNPEIILEE